MAALLNITDSPKPPVNSTVDPGLAFGGGVIRCGFVTLLDESGFFESRSKSSSDGPSYTYKRDGVLFLVSTRPVYFVRLKAKVS